MNAPWAQDANGNFVPTSYGHRFPRPVIASLQRLPAEPVRVPVPEG
ncbi:hypothetical protein ACSHWO_34485 [Streptomyces sp. HUAS TT3]